ncbi:MAG: translation initiation factor IF-2 [Gemmatimonadetes bacterium]|nr:translation initiation factor IF-2 [Gemmatimonadota bacterium]
MRVLELAKDLKVDTEVLIQLLLEMGIAVKGASAQVNEADAARVVARMERSRRSGANDATEAVQAAVEDAGTGARRRRRRVASSEPEGAEPAELDAASTEPEPGPEPVEEPDTKPVRRVAAKAAEAEPEVAPAAPPRARREADASPEVPEGARPRARAKPETRTESAPEPAPTASSHPPLTSARADAESRLSAGRVPPAAAAAAAAAEAWRRQMRKPIPAASAGPAGTVRIQASGYTPDGRKQGAVAAGKEKKKGKKRQRVDQDAVAENISRVMAEIKGGGKKRRHKGMGGPSREELELQEMQDQEEAEREAKTVRVNEFLTVAELAELIDVSSTEIIGSAFKNLRLMVTINQRLDFDQIEMLLDEFGFHAVREEEYVGAPPEEDQEVEEESTLRPRPPVVTVMGHVDHGKTMLLDRIRKTNVVAGEAGGITQHIGAYHVELEGGRTVTFLDTPGHAAFTAMRARGADVTDIVILLVAADDSVMPQTVEAISHARNAGVPMIVAINKVDLPTAKPDQVRQQLLQHDVQVEEFGGQVMSAEISAKTGKGIDDLMEKILLQAEMLELKANPDREAQGTVIEAELDVGKGSVVTVLVQRGTLRVGQDILIGLHSGRVRALLDERGRQVKSAGPGIPVQVLGVAGVPQAGDTFQVMTADKASEISGTRQRLDREKQMRAKERGMKLGDFSRLVAEGESSGVLAIIIKGDVDGSVQAVADALEQLGTDEVEVDIIHRAVGAINESDVLLAETSGAIIMGFGVRPDAKSRQLAERDGVEIKLYDVIYNAVDDVRAALEGMLTPEQKETILGAAEVRQVFKIKGIGAIAGCYVTEGTIERKAKVRVIRQGVIAYQGDLGSLKRFKDDVKEVREGFECGIGVANYNDLKVGDVVEAFRVEQVARTLAGAAEGR